MCNRFISSVYIVHPRVNTQRESEKQTSSMSEWVKSARITVNKRAIKPAPSCHFFLHWIYINTIIIRLRSHSFHVINVCGAYLVFHRANMDFFVSYVFVMLRLCETGYKIEMGDKRRRKYERESKKWFARKAKKKNEVKSEYERKRKKNLPILH